MSADKIEITYAEVVRVDDRSFVRQIEWRRNGAYSRAGGDGGATIPDDVRVALAMLIAPGLVEARR